MELNVYRLLLPEGTLDYFDVVDVKERVNEIVIYLEEKNLVPEQYSGEATESKGFYDPVVVQDFPLRGKKVYLNIPAGLCVDKELIERITGYPILDKKDKNQRNICICI